MRGIALYNPSLNGVSQYAVEKSYSPRRGPWPASYDGLTSQFSCLETGFGFAGDHILQDLIDIRPGEVLHSPRAHQWNNVTVDSTDVADNGCRLFRASTFAHNQAGIQVLEIEPAQFFDRYGLMVELSLFRWIFPTRDLAEENPASWRANSGVQKPCTPMVNRRERPANL